jgi:hypothetical protein
MGEEAVGETEPETDMWAKVQQITTERLEQIEKKTKASI